jgi:hypothetical protein
MLADALKEFENQCENYYYVEYFWFPGQKKTWINNWKNDGDCNDEPVEYPCEYAVKYQELTTFLSGIANNTIFELFSPRFQMNVLSTFAMLDMPERKDDNPIVAPLIEGLHFRRGIQNMRVNDMEWEIPIPALKSDPTKPGESIGVYFDLHEISKLRLKLTMNFFFSPRMSRLFCLSEGMVGSD